MRIHVRHLTRYSYDRPVRSVIQLLRLTPANHECQHVLNWRIDVDVDSQLRQGTDNFGNIVHRLFVEKPVKGLEIAVTGAVDTGDSHGILRGQDEPLLPAMFRRSTPLTRADDSIRAFADDVRREDDPLLSLHQLLARTHETVRFDTRSTDVATSAADAFAQRSGVCQDLAHIFIACARHLGFPARYVSGHLARTDRSDQEAAHAWAEALVPGLGWVAFDPANGISATEAYVRVAVGLDYLDAAPVRGARYGGAGERMDVELTVAEAPSQTQTQSQTQ